MELRTRCFISIGGAPEIPLEELTPEQRAAAGTRMRDRMRAALQEYYGAHPEEWAALEEART